MSNDKIVQTTIIGKVYKENKGKTFRLNRLSEEYFKLIKLYVSIGLELRDMSKSSLHELTYSNICNEFNLATGLIQTARDKSVEIIKSFKKSDKGKTEKKRKSRTLKMKRVSIRFDQRTFKLDKTDHKLSQYWITLSTTGQKYERVNLPIYFGKDQIEKLENGWRPASVEMVKKNGEWYAHITIEKWIKFKEPKTVIGIDVGEVNFASCIAVPINNQKEYRKGYIERGEEIKRIRGLYGHIRRSLGRKKLPNKIKEIGIKENRKVDQEVHIISNRIIEYVKQFEDPIISMEDLTNIRYNFNASKKLNKRFHSLPFYKLRKYIEYKANSEGIDVRFIEPYDTSKTCHICGNVSHVNGREYRCKACGMIYNRDLNASINIAHFLMRDMGWRRNESLGPTNEDIDAKSDLNVGNSFNDE
jgi:IS605 OrfB family transposase